MIIEEIYNLFCDCSQRFSTDSRSPEGIFFALKGDTHDAHDFVPAALAGGADYAVVEREIEGGPIEKLIRVENVENTLQALALKHRRQFRGRVIAITGTNGKTTTKELTAAALGATTKELTAAALGATTKELNQNKKRELRVLYTLGNLNNHLGVPFTLLRLSPMYDVAVIEMGANHPGEIDFLCRIAEPEWGLITNIGMAHLEGFGSPDGVIRTKGELFRYLASTGGRAFYNSEDPTLCDLVTGIESLSATGFAPPKTSNNEAGELVINIDGTDIATHLTGAYNASNIAAALALATEAGVSKGAAMAAIGAYAPINNRSQIIKTQHNTLYMDAYNANPSSMYAAINNFASIPGKKLAILGQMNELGAYATLAHAELVALTDKLELKAMLIGQEFAPFAASHRVFATTDDLAAHINANTPRATKILIKGSNSLNLSALPQKCPEL